MGTKFKVCPCGCGRSIGRFNVAQQGGAQGLRAAGRMLPVFEYLLELAVIPPDRARAHDLVDLAQSVYDRELSCAHGLSLPDDQVTADLVHLHSEFERLGPLARESAKRNGDWPLPPSPRRPVAGSW